jgi:cytochrome bd-type quinol oxidase subunit 1
VLGAELQVVRKHKRNRALLLIFFPVAIIIFLIGWSLTCTGTQEQPRKTHAKPPKQNVHLEAIPLEEKPEITH